MALENGCSGSISGWDSISFDQSGTTEGAVPTSFSASETMVKLLELRRDLDPKKLVFIQQMISDHISNLNNPHDDSEQNISINVFNDLYHYWLSLGNTGDAGVFASILFQDDARATLIDIINGIGSGLVDVSSANGLIGYHNSDPNAHPALLSLYFPGTVPTGDPSFSMMASIGVPDINVTTPRTTPLTYIDASGTLATADPGVVVTDYMTGRPLYSIWDVRVNLINNSDPITNASVSFHNTTSVNSDPGVRAPDRSTTCCILSDTTAASFHGMTLPIPVSQGIEYTDSCFVFPLMASGYLHFMIAGLPNVGFWIDVSTGLIVSPQSDSYIGYSYRLASGWIRIGLQYVAASSGVVTFNLNYTPTLNVDGYQGTNAQIFALYGLMHAQGPGVSPYIPTTNGSVEVDASPLIVYAPNLINPTNGMMSFTYNQSNFLSSIDKTLIESQDTLFKITLSPATVTATLNQSSGTNFATTCQASPYDLNTPITTALSYSSTDIILKTSGQPRIDAQSTFSPIDTATNMFQIGPLDGYLDTFIIYPMNDTANDLEFLVGEN